jgi:hypothetical protein
MPYAGDGVGDGEALASAAGLAVGLADAPAEQGTFVELATGEDVAAASARAVEVETADAAKVLVDAIVASKEAVVVAALPRAVDDGVG